MGAYFESSNGKSPIYGLFSSLTPEIMAATESAHPPVAHPKDEVTPETLLPKNPTVEELDIDIGSHDQETSNAPDGGSEIGKSVTNKQTETKYSESLGALLALEISKSRITSQQKVDVLSILSKIESWIEIRYEDNINSKTPLMYAVEANERDLVEWLLDHDEDVGAIDSIGQTALFYAVCNGHADVLRDLLQRNPPLNTLNDAGQTLLELAIHDVELVEILLDGGADIELQNDKGLTVLSIAIAEKCAELVRLLVDRGAIRPRESSGLSISMDVQLNNTLLKNATRPIGGNPALRFATLNMPGIVLPVLLEFPKSFDLETGDMDGDNSLVLASEKDPKGIRQLLQAGTNVNSQTSGETALMKKAQYEKDGLATFDVIFPEPDQENILPNICGNRTRAIDLNSACRDLDLSSIFTMLVAGANPNDCGPELMTPPIITACCSTDNGCNRDEFFQKRHKVVEMLLDGGVDLHREYQCTPSNALSAAALNSGVSLIDFFMERGANPHGRDSIGRLPIHFAAVNGVENLQSLFSHAEDTIWSTDYTGKAPLHWAAQFGNAKTVEFILNQLSSEKERCDHVNQSDINGWTPICWAICASGTTSTPWQKSESGDFVETIKVLLEYGADICMQLPRGSGLQLNVITPLNLAILYHATVEVGQVLVENIKNATGGMPSFEEYITPYDSAHRHCDVCLIVSSIPAYRNDRWLLTSSIGHPRTRI